MILFSSSLLLVNLIDLESRLMEVVALYFTHGTSVDFHFLILMLQETDDFLGEVSYLFSSSAVFVVDHVWKLVVDARGNPNSFQKKIVSVIHHQLSFQVHPAVWSFNLSHDFLAGLV